MSRVRRRFLRTSTEAARWEQNRDWEMSRARPGDRPVGWWKYESERPDLAPSNYYAHIGDTPRGFDVDLSPANDRLEREREKLRYLRDTGELRPDEIAELHRLATAEKTPGRWAWRLAVLEEVPDD